MSNCRFSQGKVALLKIDSNGQRSLVWQDWNENMNDENQTGYGPGGKNGKGNWILDFAGAAKRTSSGADPNVPTRYKDETVNISLALPGAKGKGRKVIRGQAPRLGN